MDDITIDISSLASRKAAVTVIGQVKCAGAVESLATTDYTNKRMQLTNLLLLQPLKMASFHRRNQLDKTCNEVQQRNGWSSNWRQSTKSLKTIPEC